MNAPQNPNPNPNQNQNPDPSEPRPSPRRSPGPRSLDALRKTRQNALSHGLTATLPDGEAEIALMKSFADTWTQQLGCDNDAEEALIRSSALAYARLERCRKAEEAALAESSRLALEHWQKSKQQAARKLAQGLSADPSNTVADLEASSFGCEWLLRHWLQLDAKLSQGIVWDHDDVARSMLLLGLYPQAPGPDADTAVRRVWHLARCCGRAPFDPVPGVPTDLIPARLELRRLIAAEVDRLDTLRDRRWRERDAAEADAVAHLGLIDTSKEGQLRQRYRREAYSEMIRGINQVMRIRVERSKDQDRQWHQAHPHLSARRAPAAAPPSPPPSPPMPPPTPEPDPGRAPSPDTAPARSRNESPEAAPETQADRLNPQSQQEMRRDGSPADVRPDQRTEPQSTGFSRPSIDPRTPHRPPVEGHPRPSGGDLPG
ncbi:hypothetical protein AB1L88_19355 [Tautonia sp. JC769]|uniref:hypothetical protein n=1 Tax=Tautonia sp. JC769 TaxID=3232135 RepID=UPI003458C3FB